jgi:tetratricopeptide (TPR) repeat protein
MMLTQWLSNARGGGWPTSDVLLRTGANASKEHLEGLLAQLCLGAAEPGDLVFIYFAGHAFLDEASGEGYLACPFTRHRAASTGIHLHSLVRQVLLPSRASQIVLLLDCFQTGAAWDALRATPYDARPFIGEQVNRSLQQGQGRLLYYSCRGNILAPETGQRQLGALAYSTIVGLSGPAQDAASGAVTLQRLHSYLNSVLDSQHQPQVFGHESRPIVLAGEAPVLVSATSTAQMGYSHASLPQAPAAPPSGQMTFQGVGESGPLLDPALARPQMDGQTASSASGPISISQVEQNYQQQITKLLQQARQQILNQNLPEALQLVEQILRMAPTYPDALMLKAQILGSTGRTQEALVAAEQLAQLEPGNALAWSMLAALLSNAGKYPEALSAIERCLALQPNNTEALAMRSSIQAGLASMPDNKHRKAYNDPRQAIRENATSFFLYAGLQIVAFVIGIAGAALMILQPHLPILIGFALESAGLAMLCVLAARGAYLYGIGRVIVALVFCLAAAGVLGGLYKFGYHYLVGKVQAFPPLLISVLFLAFWIIAAAVLPLLLSMGGFIVGLARGVRRRSL